MVYFIPPVAIAGTAAATRATVRMIPRAARIVVPSFSPVRDEVPGLLLDSAVTLFAIAYLLSTHRLPVPLKAGSLALISVWTFYAVANNYSAIEALGLSPLGLS